MQRVHTAEFLPTYEPYARRLEDFYRRSQMVGIETITECPRYDGAEVVKLGYRGNGSCIRLDTAFIEKKRNRKWQEWVRIATPDGGFNAARYDEDGPFTLKSFSRDGAMNDIAIRWDAFVSAPYQYRDLTILQFLSLPRVRVDECVLFSRNNESLIRVTCSQPKSTPTKFVFSIDKGWALVEQCTGDAGRAEHVRVDYDMRGDFPIVSRREKWTEYSDGSAVNRHVVEVIDFVASPANEDGFELSSIGIHGGIPAKDFST